MNSTFSDSSSTPPTLVDLLMQRARQQPDRRAYTFLVDGEDNEICLTYRELDRQARAVGAMLQRAGVTGGRALLLYPQGLDYIAAFFGCLYAGVVAVPAYPPRLNRPTPRLRSVVADAQPTITLSTSGIRSDVQNRFALVPYLEGMRWLATDTIVDGAEDGWAPLTVDGDSLAFLQYTSGSAAVPKGVMVSHSNLLHNSRMIQKAFGHTDQSVHVSWLPLFHDMGLIMTMLQAVYIGAPCILLSPAAFVQRPIRWLRAIARYGAHTSGAPDFAYDLCVRKIPAEQREGLDLSSWRVAFNGAEPVRHGTLERFAETFAPHGFRREALNPCYGLAEATVFVSGSSPARPVAQAVRTAALERNLVVATDRVDREARVVVGCGHAASGQTLAIVDPEARTPCAPDKVGEIWVAGPNVARGYWRRAEETQATFGAYLASERSPEGADTSTGPFLRTGDLGFMRNGELFVTGRRKDVIIIHGRNHYPQDVELTVEQSHPALRPGCGAAFTVEVAGEEQLVIAQEVEREARNVDRDAVLATIRRAVADEHEIRVYAVALLKTGTVPKTSSGKIQHRVCRARFLDNSLEVVGMWMGDDAAAGTRDSRARADELIAWLRDYANRRVNSRLIDERRGIPPHVVLDFGNHGLLSMQAPEVYGGLGLRTRDAMRVLEQLAAVDLTLATFVCDNNFLGIRPIQRYGTQAARDALLPLLSTGRELAAFALTEPDAGSNVRAITSRAVADGDGGWRLHGAKVWSGSASWASVINVFVQLTGEDGEPRGVTGFVVRQGATGVRMGPEALTMGLRGMTQNSLDLDGARVGPEDILATPGTGMDAAQDALMFTRLCLGAMSVGGMKRCAQLMHRYATRRAIATGRLLDNPVTLARLSDLTAAITAAETLVALIAGRLDAEQPVPEEIFIACKTFGPECLSRAADTLVQFLGGRGYVETNVAPQLLRDARVLRIFEGPTETLNMFLGSRVMSQGADLHAFLCDQLGGAAISARLKDAGERIQARCSGPHAPFPERAAGRQWASALVGEVATCAIVWAAVREGGVRTPSGDLRRADDWARSRFEHALTQALMGTPAESVLPGVTETSRLVTGYIEAIGDLEQTLPGEDDALDALLRRDVSSLDATHVPTQSKIDLPNDAPVARDMTPPLPAVASIEAWVSGWIAHELGVPVNTIDARASFTQYGLDSVTAVMLVGALEEQFGQRLSPTLTWEYPTVEALAAHVAAHGASEIDDPQGDGDIMGRETTRDGGPVVDDDILGGGRPDALLTRLDHLSDEDVDAVLSRLLAEQGAIE